MPGVFFPRPLDFVLALRGLHVEVLDRRERRAFWGADNHVGSGFPDQGECLLPALMFVEIPDLAVWAWGREV